MKSIKVSLLKDGYVYIGDVKQARKEGLHKIKVTDTMPVPLFFRKLLHEMRNDWRWDREVILEVRMLEEDLVV